MHGPVLVNWLLAVLAAASGAYCLSRLRRSPCAAGTGCAAAPGYRGGGPQDGARRGAGGLLARESDAAEALMGLGTAAMAVAGSAVPPVVWAWLFGVPAAAFLVAALGPVPGAPGRRAHRLHHAVGGLTMTYMALAMTAGPTGAAGPAGAGHAQHAGGAGLPLLTGALLLYFGGYALWSGSRLLSAPVGGVPAGGVPAGTAGLARACRLAMGIGMFAMLLTL
ncbi:DUF5134 domain-containing protein [Kitasatospora sp. NPDC004240]